MKTRRIFLFRLSAFLLSLLLIINPFGLGRLTTGKANAQKDKYSAPRPFVVFVDGSGDCCAWAMDNLQNRLVQELNADIWETTYASFRDGSTTRQISIPRTIALSVDADAAFLREGADYINNRLERNRPLILIGHSFGGDSILSLIPRINRRIQFVAVIDPVSAGGLRQTIVQNRSVPSNVDYFFNRWQENQPFPFDFGRSGQVFSCEASSQGRRNCDQDSQNIARNADFSPVTRECRWDEVTCPGFVAPNPLIGRSGRRGRAQVRVSHQDLPRDAYLQQVLGDRIIAQRASWAIQNRLYIRSFNGQTFGEVLSSQAVSGVDLFREWSWDGRTASYISFENGQSTLTVRPFDGQTFGPVSSSQVVSSSDSFRGWSWDGRTASYVAIDGSGRSILYVRPFDGRTFGSVTSSQAVSDRDIYRGWSWDGRTASYVAIDGSGRSILYVRPFDGRTFGSVISSQAVSDRDIYRGWNWYEGLASYVTR